jgi:uncharacterized protein
MFHFSSFSSFCLSRPPRLGHSLVPLYSRHWAALFGRTETGLILIQAGSNVDAQTKTGETCLHLSAEKGYVAFVRMLLENGADMTIADKKKQLPYNAAKANKYAEAASLLNPRGSGCCTIM